MRFRLKGLAWHLLGSVTALTLVLGGLYLGWYRWPGWYLADAARVTLVLACVDLVAGPLLTFVIAGEAKSRKVLARDIAVIGVMQLAALAYGALSLWHGRPLYYAFSEDVLQLVQAYDLDDSESSFARRQEAPLAPHWYSLPRWIWAPLPQDPSEHDRIVASAVNGGDDVISIPRYYRTWEAGLPTLRTQLKRIEDVKYFSGREKSRLTERVRAAGLAPDEANSMALIGRGRPLLAVFDPATMKIVRMFRSD